MLLADAVIGISMAILILLFIFQRVGTSKVGFTFSPIVVYWYLLNGGCGIFNIARYYPGIFKVLHLCDLSTAALLAVGLP